MSQRIVIEFEDIAYRVNHGASPRGRGSWAFALERNPYSDAVWFAPGGLTLKEAKAHARAHYTEIVRRQAPPSAWIGDSALRVIVYVQP